MTTAIVLAALAAPAPALAQAQNAGASALQAPIDRKGFVIGFSVGGGSASCATCETKGAAALSFHLGGMLTPRVALLYDTAAVNFTDHGYAYQPTVSTVALQYFTSDRVWVKGGVGLGSLWVDNHSGSSHLGLLAAAGVELAQKRRFAMDLSGRFTVIHTSGSDVRSVSAQLGFNWY